MHLILSSCDFSHPLSRARILSRLERPLESYRVLFVPNERATHAAIQSGKYQSRLQKYGFAPECVSVFDEHDFSPSVLRKIDMIYISGGNTFETMAKIRRSGLAQPLIETLKQGAVYIGGSAGAHVVTKDLAHVCAFDENTADLTDLRGLGLFDGRLICHADEERCARMANLLAEDDVYALSDGDVLSVRGGRIERVE